MAKPDFNAILLAPVVWDNTTVYKRNFISIGGAFILTGVPVVTYSGNTYYASATVNPTPGTLPTADAGWIAWV